MSGVQVSGPLEDHDGFRRVPYREVAPGLDQAENVTLGAFEVTVSLTYASNDF